MIVWLTLDPESSTRQEVLETIDNLNIPIKSKKKQSKSSIQKIFLQIFEKYVFDLMKMNDIYLLGQLVKVGEVKLEDDIPLPSIFSKSLIVLAGDRYQYDAITNIFILSSLPWFQKPFHNISTLNVILNKVCSIRPFFV